VKVGLVGYFANRVWLKTQKRLTAWFVGVPGRASEISEESPRPEQKECDSRVPERDVNHANHRNAHSREVTVRSGAGRSRGCVQCPVRLRDRESNLVTREGWCKRQEGSPQWPSPNGRDLKRGLDDEPTCPAFGHAGFPCWWSPPPESNRRPHPYHGSEAKRRAIPRCGSSRDSVHGEVMGSVAALVGLARSGACRLMSLLARSCREVRWTALPARPPSAAKANGHQSPPPVRSSGTS
jgi:hypothetical protein